MKRRIHWQVYGQRCIKGGFQLFSASGFGSTAAEAIDDALRCSPDRSAWSHGELTATPDPIEFTQGASEAREPHKLLQVGSTPTPAPILRSLVVALTLALVVAGGTVGRAQSDGRSGNRNEGPESLSALGPDRVGSIQAPAFMPSSPREYSGGGTYFDRDFWAGCILFGLSAIAFVFAGCWVTQYPDRRDDEEQARRVRHLSNILEGPL